MRNLDVTTLRSFVAVADNGGVTRAAGFLHLTQSAVSMQLKRLEDMLGVELLDRTGRRIALTAAGEQLLAYARRMVALNDEIMSRLSEQSQEGELTLGVPYDVVYPAIPRVLQQFNAAFPKVRVHLISSFTLTLKEQFARGEVDMTLTTESGTGEGAEALCTKPLVWIGAQGGVAWRQRPLKLAFGRHCVFRPHAVAALDRAGFDWELTVESDSDRSIEAAVAADLAVQIALQGTQPSHLEVIEHGGALPDLPEQKINLMTGKSGDPARDVMADLLRAAFSISEAPRLKAV
ncbi:LysR family transcriptional regulator [Aliishimia ponticola]|uniref:LysR family transcriptional regulator n=1 Tax=Aliishimia ponticola TaxID=2499833 RepID=A0A4S4N9B3_9RHOB|nr:LysR family transcriptional regulator [Aliishimia ponticola]THH35834.1 LysR family transcriptional regulator [Aliishimia ponticola]